MIKTTVYDKESSLEFIPDTLYRCIHNNMIVVCTRVSTLRNDNRFIGIVVVPGEQKEFQQWNSVEALKKNFVLFEGQIKLRNE